VGRRGFDDAVVPCFLQWLLLDVDLELVGRISKTGKVLFLGSVSSSASGASPEKKSPKLSGGRGGESEMKDMLRVFPWGRGGVLLFWEFTADFLAVV
jgi:hypothetical protein